MLKKIRHFLKKLGPGIITGTSDDDPSGIATYSQAGASFGFIFLWTAILTYPFLYAVQEMCARISIATNLSLTGVIKKYYPRWLAVSIIFLIIPSLILNIISNLAGVGAVFHLLFPIIPSFVSELIVTFVMGYFILFFSYELLTKIMKFFCLSLLCYIFVPFFVEINISEVIYHTFIPILQFEKNYWAMLGAILGTTISPYLFFWQSYMSLEKKRHEKKSDCAEIKEMKTDVNLGMFTSNLAMYFIILATGAVLFPENKQIETVSDAASALKPITGEMSYLLFSLGVIGVGILTIPILSLCIGYLLAEMFEWKRGCDYTPREAPYFYFTVILSLLFSLLVNFFEIDPIKSLIFTATVYGYLAPFLILLILVISNRKDIMDKKTNHKISNFLGIMACIFILTVHIILAFFEFFNGPK